MSYIMGKCCDKMRIIFLMLLISVSSFCFSQTWYKILENGEDYIEIDLETVKRQGNIINVWTRETYSDYDKRKKYIDENLHFLHEHEYRKGIPQDVLLNWAAFKYTLTYVVYDRSLLKRKVLSIIDYTQYGEVLNHVDFDNISEYERLIPGSIGMEILKILEEKHKYAVNGKVYNIPIEKVDIFLREFPNAELIE